MERSGNPVKICVRRSRTQSAASPPKITRLLPRLCHATRDDISIAGSPPAGEDDELGGFCKNDGVGCLSPIYSSLVIYRLVPALQLLITTVLVLVTVVAAESPPAGEDDGKNHTYVILAAPVSSFPP